MIAEILAIASSSGLGAVFGLIGGHLAKVEKRKSRVINNEHEARMLSLEMQSDAAESTQALAMADKQVDLAMAESEIASEVAAGEAFTISQTMAGKSTGIGFVDAIRGLMRPLITMYLLGVTTFLAYSIDKLLGGLNTLPITDLFSLYNHIIYQLIFLTVTAVAWWFSSRGTK